MIKKINNKKILIRLITYPLLIILCWSLFNFSQRWIEKIEIETTEIYRKMEEHERKKEKAFIEVYFFDIKGDAILINYSNEYQILLDGGFSKNKLLRRVQQFMPENDKKIEALICTHKHKDHYNGFPAVLSEFKTDLLIKNFSGLNGTTRDMLGEQGAEIKTFWSGDILKIDDLLQLNFLSPNKEKEELYPDENDKSLVFRFRFGRNLFLFMGDGRLFVEEELLERNVNLKADFLKVGHHGYSTASSEKFLEKVRPKNAIITNGHSSYNPIIKERLENFGAKVHLASSSLDEMIMVKCFYKDKDCEVILKKEIDTFEESEDYEKNEEIDNIKK
jgi:competence protein ComEC